MMESKSHTSHMYTLPPTQHPLTCTHMHTSTLNSLASARFTYEAVPHLRANLVMQQPYFTAEVAAVSRLFCLNTQLPPY
jgi:hypothetical protein